MIILQEAVLFLPVLKNVFNETAWEPHGDKSARAPKAPSPTALRSFREDLGAWQLQAVHISCDFITPLWPTATLPPGKRTLIADGEQT